MFDVALAAEQTERFTAEVPGLDEAWEIGLVVGPSGSGKSTIARRQWPAAYTTARSWPEDRAVIDGFAAGSIKDITGMLTAVGFSSPPHWIKPYRVLSNGERFRCDLARAILEGGDLVVFDEFTSVVDRTVARIGSAAVAKAIRRLGRRFVAISCHYDIARGSSRIGCWTCRVGRLHRRRLRRPAIRLDLYRSPASAWPMFAKYHYLSSGLNRTAHCYLGLIDGQPAAFCAVLPVDRLRRPAADFPDRRASRFSGRRRGPRRAQRRRRHVSPDEHHHRASGHDRGLEERRELEMYRGQEDRVCQAAGGEAKDLVHRRADPDVVQRPRGVQF